MASNQFVKWNLVVLFLLCASGIVAQEEKKCPVGVNFDFTYASKYLWRGYDYYADHGAFQPSITMDYEGFYLGVWGSWPSASGYEDWTEMDYYGGYSHLFFPDDRHALSTDLSYTYFDYVKMSNDEDAQEIMLILSMPNLLPLGPGTVIPSYTLAYDWHGVQGGGHIDDGWFHIFGLAYDFPFQALIPEQEEQYLSLAVDTTYNDGAYGSEPALSHTTANLSTTFEWNQFYFTPATGYQWSHEDTVNDEDEWFFTLSVGYYF
ncbi:hypothetical protein GF373_16910 [bacterium]|nr:hypothetical protein [bacterium]